jgi:hypothetical protein
MKNSHKIGFYIYISSIVVLVLGFVILVSEKLHLIDLYHKKPINTVIITTDTSQSTTASSNNDQNTTNDTSISSDDETKEAHKSPNTNSNKILVAPNGNFVSNHAPNLSGSPAPSSIVSACTTTPGANCYIVFTKGSDVITLKSQTTDSNGNTSWSWNLQDNQFTVGDWQITAYSTLADKILSSTDPTPLRVSQ